MIDISADLGRVPHLLTALASDTTAVRLVYVAAQTYEAEIHKTIKSGQAFKTRTGQLEQSVGWIPVGTHSAEVYANAKHAPFVEHGTRPHIINAKNRKMLKIPSAGGFIFRRSVNHPGSRPFPYFYRDMPVREQKVRAAVLAELAQIEVESG